MLSATVSLVLVLGRSLVPAQDDRQRFDPKRPPERELEMTLRGPFTLPESGVPRLASPEMGRQILERLALLSRPYGTEIAIEGNVGVVRPGDPR